MMTLPFFDDDTTGYIDVNSLSARFFCKNANSSRMRTFARYPRAASDDEANALIADKFANVIDDLLNSKHALFIHFGMYWYAIAILDSRSRAVAILLAKSRMIFSGQKVVSQRA